MESSLHPVESGEPLHCTVLSKSEWLNLVDKQLCHAVRTIPANSASTPCWTVLLSCKRNDAAEVGATRRFKCFSLVLTCDSGWQALEALIGNDSNAEDAQRCFLSILRCTSCIDAPAASKASTANASPPSRTQAHSTTYSRLLISKTMQTHP